jgi:hypothetical protein
LRYFKRNKTWWADFSVNGQRFRVSLETTDRRAAVGVANKKLAQAEHGKLSATSQSFARLAFGEAAEKYLGTRKLDLAKSSLAKETQLLVKLKKFCDYSTKPDLSRTSAQLSRVACQARLWASDNQHGSWSIATNIKTRQAVAHDGG